MTDTPIQATQEVGSIGGTGWQDDPVLIEPVEISTPNTNIEKESWYSRNASWLNPLLGGIAGISTGGLLPAILGIVGGVATTYLQNKYNKEAYQQQKEDALAAEQRANAEYDRRVDEANAYNENWAQRLMKQGINPLSYITKGQAGAMASSTPSSSSSPIVPMSPARQVPNISGLLEVAQAVTAMKHTQAQTDLIKSQAEAQANENLTYWDRLRASLNETIARTKNTEAITRVNQATASFKEATLEGDIQRASYELRQAFNEMQRSGVSVEQARVELQRSLNVVAMQAIEKELMSQEFILNGQRIKLNDLSLQDFALQLEVNRKYLDANAQAALSNLQEQVRHAQKANNWYAVDKVIGSISSLAGSVSTVVNALKPYPQILSTTTTTEGVNTDGGWQTFSHTTRTNTYK